MSGALRKEVKQFYWFNEERYSSLVTSYSLGIALRVFKKLHRTRLKTFQGDEHALDAARRRINDEYRKNKNLSDEASISELIKFAEAVETEVRTTVVQAVEKEPGTFELRITEDTVMVNNEVLPGSYIPKGKLKKCSDASEKKT